jgi:hypothetical protein
LSIVKIIMGLVFYFAREFHRQLVNLAPEFFSHLYVFSNVQFIRGALQLITVIIPYHTLLPSLVTQSRNMMIIDDSFHCHHFMFKEK